MGLLGRQVRHAVIGQEFGSEFPVLHRDGLSQLLFELCGIEFAHSLVFLGNDEIDAIGSIADVLVDPLALHFELLR